MKINVICTVHYAPLFYIIQLLPCGYIGIVDYFPGKKITTRDGVLSELVPSGYSILHMPRSGKRGGGVAVVFAKGLDIKLIDSNPNTALTFTHFEHMDCHVSNGDKQTRLCVIYRPPPSKQNGFTNRVFFDEWTSYLDGLAVVSQDLVITGDLNFHLDNQDAAGTRQFSSSLESYGLVHHVTTATHIQGHTLDVLITREDGSILHSEPLVMDPCLSDIKGNPSGDHLAVHAKLNIGKPGSIRKENTFRRLRAISVPDFIMDIEQMPRIQCTSGSLDDLVDAYNSGIRTLMDKHAPQQVKTITLRPNAPWYTDELRSAKHKRRKAERLWRKTKLTVHHQLFKQECQNVSTLLMNSKKEYYSKKIVECGNEHKLLFHLTKNLMGNNRELSLPTCSTEDDLAKTNLVISF